jgi:hypothetical protein
LVVSLPTDFNDEWASAWEWARMYRDQGLQVVPAHTPHAGNWKRPAVETWTEFQHVLIPDLLFARWYDPNTGEHRQRRNMGLITGKASRDLVVVDLDVAEGKDGRSWWTGLIAVEANGLEPETVSQVTGGGGRQILFIAPEGWEPPTFKASAVGVDVRGQGGFIMCPPSLHASGRIYDWELGREPWAIPIAPAPPWLCAAIDKLRLEHGGHSSGPRERTDSGETKNAFGRDIDGREQKLADIAWALVVDARRDAPMRPTTAMLEAEIARAFAQYELTTKSRLEPRPGHDNAALLELEDRGLSALWAKVTYALTHWDGKVAEAALIPKSRDENENTWGGDFSGPELESESRKHIVASRSFGELRGEPPERRWLVPGWIARGEVNSLYGGGATGKSLLALLLGHAMAVGAPWIGLPTIKGSSLFVSCEDDADELWRRHADIRKGLGYGIGNPFAEARWLDRVGHNNLLAVPDARGVMSGGPFLPELMAELDAERPTLVILDTLADVYGGNEIDRVQVNGFLKTCLGGLIQQRKEAGHDLTILLLGHPSKSSLADGSGFSGSTAWENGVRSRLYLSRPENAGPDERILTRAKANYAGGDDGELPLLWSGGIFVGASELKEAERVAVTVQNEVAFAWSMGTPYVEKRGHPRNLHAALVKRLLTDSQPRELIISAIRLAIDDGLIRPSGNKSKRGWRSSEGD